MLYKQKDIYDICYIGRVTKPTPPEYRTADLFLLEVNHGDEPVGEKYAYTTVGWKEGTVPQKRLHGCCKLCCKIKYVKILIHRI